MQSSCSSSLDTITAGNHTFGYNGERFAMQLSPLKLTYQKVSSCSTEEAVPYSLKLMMLGITFDKACFSWLCKSEVKIAR